MSTCPHLSVCVCVLQAELKDEAEKPSESAEKSDKTEVTDKVKKEGGETSEREEESEEGGEAKTAPAGNTETYILQTFNSRNTKNIFYSDIEMSHYNMYFTFRQANVTATDAIKQPLDLQTSVQKDIALADCLLGFLSSYLPDKDKEEAVETSSSEQEKDKEEKATTEEGEEKRKKLEHDIGEGNIATAAAAALASAATKAKV